MNRFVILMLIALSSVGKVESAPPVVTLYSPVTFQVFQRGIDHTGALSIRGHIEGISEYPIIARWNGLENNWHGIGADFNVLWEGLPVGQSDFILTIADIMVTIPVVSIGDVYVIAGQSNAVGQGVNLQTYMNSVGLRASMFGNDYQWKELSDPTDSPLNAIDSVSTDGSYGGSIWPLLASYILNSCIPVAFVPTARGGMSIRSWQPNPSRNTLEGALEARLISIGHIRAVLWQQGESDAHHAMKSRTYADLLVTLTDRITGKFGIPFFVATIAPGHYSSGWKAINEGVALAISERSNTILPGADLTSLTPDASDTVHFTSDENLQLEARLWWEALVNAGYYSKEPCF